MLLCMYIGMMAMSLIVAYKQYVVTSIGSTPLLVYMNTLQVHVQTFPASIYDSS